MDPLKDLENFLNVTLETVGSLKSLKLSSNKSYTEPILTVKTKCLANYQLNLLKIKQYQTENPGASLQEDEDTSEAVYQTTVERTKLERIRNLENKVQPKIDNYLRILEEGKVDEKDPNFLRPKLDSDDDDDDDENYDDSISEKSSGSEQKSKQKFDGDDEEIDSDEFGADTDEEDTSAQTTKKSSKTHLELKDERQNKPTGKYVPPKLVPAPYPFEKPTKQDSESSKKKEKALKSNSAMAELLNELGDAPTETMERGANPTSKHKMSKVLRDMKLREQEEEENYKRFNKTKKQKRQEEAAMTRDEFESIETIGGMDALLSNDRAKAYMAGQKKGRGGKVNRGGKRTGSGDMMLLKNMGKKKKRR